MSPLPVLTTTCTADTFDARLVKLSALSDAQAKRRARARTGALFLLGSFGVGIICHFAFSSRTFSDASRALLAIGTLLILYRILPGRASPTGRWVFLGLAVVVLLLGVAVDFLPTPEQALSALDVRAFPAEALVASTLSLAGVSGALVWDAAAPPDRTGGMVPAIAQYAAGLARPLLGDAASGARCLVRLSPFAPGPDHWREQALGELVQRTFERFVCEVRVPLEAGEQFVLAVTERVTTRQRRRRNAHGKLKVKSKGHVRSVEACLSWSLRTRAPNSADLTQQLITHFENARVPPSGVALRARGEPTFIEVRLRHQLRSADATPTGDLRWLDATLVHESARFLAGVRATLANDGRPRAGEPTR